MCALSLLALSVLALPLVASAGAQGLDLAAHAGMSASASSRFVIRIPRVLQMKLLKHPAHVDVTAQDVEKGEVVVRGARIGMIANHREGTMVRAEVRGGVFSGMRLTGMTREIASDRSASVTALPPTRIRDTPAPVEYRLALAANALPGRYSWPVLLTIQDP